MFIYFTSKKAREKAALIVDNKYLIAFVGGASGSIIAQIFSVPIDVVSQHMMLVGQQGAKSTNSINIKKKLNVKEVERIHVPDSLKNASSIRILQFITQEIYKNENLRGFYRGYVLSTFLVSINSALWWPFYYFYQGIIIFYVQN